MYRFFARRVCLGLIAFGCGSPGELDRSRFPELEDTGYAGQVGIAGAAAGGTFGLGGSAPGGAGAGGTGAGVGGSAPLGGAGGATSVGGSGAGGLAGGGQGGAGVSGAGGADVTGGCPADITVLFNRPAMEGGCAGQGCHIPGGTPPDLTSPGVDARVLNAMSSAACGARPYVGATESVIEEKITNPDPYCGEPMPFFAANALSAEDEACIIEWIDGLAAGM